MAMALFGDVHAEDARDSEQVEVVLDDWTTWNVTRPVEPEAAPDKPKPRTLTERLAAAAEHRAASGIPDPD